MSEPVFLGHMLAFEHGVIWTTQTEVKKDKALAAQIFGGKPEDLIIGECHGQDWCLWVLAIQVVIGLIRGPKWRGFKLWHVYSAGTVSVIGLTRVQAMVSEWEHSAPQPLGDAHPRRELGDG